MATHMQHNHGETMHADAPSPAHPAATSGRGQESPAQAPALEGYDTRHEHAELLLLGGALLTIVTVVLVSVSTLLG